VTTSALPALPDETRPPKARNRPGTALFEPAILRRAVVQAFVKLDPRFMVRIPVMFVVETGSAITTIEFLGNPSLFVGLVTLWLWATALFANFAEAVAEGRGKPRRTRSAAAARRRSRTG
jgi:K+-transporting ATPase ATPase B chain